MEDEPNGQIGRSLAKTGADLGYVGAAIGKILSDPSTYQKASDWVGQQAKMLGMRHMGIGSPTGSEMARGALLGLADTGNFILNAGAVMRPSRIQHLLETGQSLAPWEEPNLDYAPPEVRDADYNMKRRAEALKWLESQGSYDPVSRFATGMLSPI